MMRLRAALAATVAVCAAAPQALAAAQTWLAGGMADTGEHPRTLLMPGDLSVILDRLTRQPYADMLAVVQGQADQTAALDDQSKDNESLKAAIAKSCAFLYAVGRRYDPAIGAAVPFADQPSRRAYGDKAFQNLLSMYTRSFAKGIQPDGGLGTSEALQMWAQAYDLLKGAGFDFQVAPNESSLEPNVVQNVADLAADLFADYMINNVFILRGYLNNHRAKAAAAIGMAAIALNGADFASKESDGRYDLAQWVDFAIRYLDLVLFSLETDQEFAYQESGGYYAYTAVSHAPFFRAWHRYTGAASYTYGPWEVDEPPYYVISMAEPYTVHDFWSNPAFHGQLDYLWRIMLPDRTAPPFDDCTPGVVLPWGFYVSADLPNAPVYRWVWESSPYGKTYPGLAGAADLIAAFDDSIAPAALTAPRDTVLPIAGNVVFRPSWEPDANAVVINAEHGNAGARTFSRWGDAFDGLAGHEHPDPASFMVYAGAEPLIIDSGYLGWPNHGKVNNAYNHNILLVDDNGPAPSSIVVPASHTEPSGGFVLDEPWREGGWTLGPDGDAYLVDSYVSEHMKIAVVKTRYDAAGGFEWARRFVWLDDRYLVVYDEFTARDGLPHKVKMLLHGNGGGTSGGQHEEIEHGALWTRTNSRVRAVVLSDLPVTFSTSTAIHDHWQWDERTHSVLNSVVDLPAGQTGRFMTVMAIEYREGPDFPATPFSVGGGQVWGTSGDRTAYAASIGKCVDKPEMISDADFSVARDNGSASDFQIYGKAINEITIGVFGWSFFSDGPEVFLSSSAGGMTGYLFEATSAGRLEVVGAYPSGTGVCGLGFSEDGTTVVTKPAKGPFSLSTSEAGGSVVAAIEMTPSYKINPFHPALDVLKPVALSGAKSCDPNDGVLAYSWKIAMKPELSKADLSTPEAAETSFTPDLPGSYGIELDVSAGGASDVASILLHVEGDVREARAAIDAGTDTGVDASAVSDSGFHRDAGGHPDAATAGEAGSSAVAPARSEGGCSCAMIGI